MYLLRTTADISDLPVWVRLDFLKYNTYAYTSAVNAVHNSVGLNNRFLGS